MATPVGSCAAQKLLQAAFIYAKGKRRKITSLNMAEILWTGTPGHNRLLEPLRQTVFVQLVVDAEKRAAVEREPGLGEPRPGLGRELQRPANEPFRARELGQSPDREVGPRHHARQGLGQRPGEHCASDPLGFRGHHVKRGQRAKGHSDHVHRLGDTGVVKILDFGPAKLAGTEGVSPTAVDSDDSR